MMTNGERYRAAMGTLDAPQEELFLVTNVYGEVIEVTGSELGKYESDPYPWSDAMVVNFEQGDDNE